MREGSGYRSAGGATADVAIGFSNRFCVVERRRRLDPSAIKKEILCGLQVQGDFTVMATPAPARDPTWFKLYRTREEVLLAAAIFDTAPPTTRSLEESAPARDGIEVFFDLRHDHLGFHQFCFDPAGGAQFFEHQPYPERHATTYQPLRFRRFAWEAQAKSHSHRLHWLFVWFEAGAVFDGGRRSVCGFNLARQAPAQEEYSTWNHASGAGFQDAYSFGHLYGERQPASVSGVTVKIDDGQLRLAGRMDRGGGRLALEWADPLDVRQSIRTRWQGDRWTAVVPLDGPITPGRHRFYPRDPGGQAIEPGYFCFDIPAPAPARTFRFAVTYDVPDNMMRNHYTPARLRQEIANYAAWGIRRLHWIEYGPFSANPSFWQAPFWADTVRHTRRYTDDLLGLAAGFCHRQGMDLLGVFKPFDIGFNCWSVTPRRGSTVVDFGGWVRNVVPELAARQDCTMCAHPDWCRSLRLPVTRLRFYSEQPVRKIAPGEVVLWTSADNRTFQRYRGRYAVRQAKIRRPHFRWTPAGKVALPESGDNWVLELADLQLKEPFAAIGIDGVPPRIAQRAFALAEAFGADQREAPLTIATHGGIEHGFDFWTGWSGWANHTEPLLLPLAWPQGTLGLAFAEQDRLPTLLEPAYEGARALWLGWVRRILDSGADGVDIRTLCHHNGVSNYLRYAFAAPVREAFRARFGRDATPEFEDYERIRRIRGEFYTRFLRDAHAVTRAAGKKMAVHLETGMEVPPELDVRMQMVMEWEQWIREGLVEEISLKQWAAHSPFIHERVLPLARRAGIPVHIVSRCLPAGIDVRAIELVPRLVTEACAAGFAGYSLYEAGELQRLNSEGLPMTVGHAGAAIREASAALRRMACAGICDKGNRT